MNYADLEALHAAIGEGHVSAKAVAQRVQRELRRRRGADLDHRHPAPAQAPRRTRQGRRPRRGARRRAGAPVPVLHAGARRRDRRLRHPGPGRVGPPGRLRQRRRPAPARAARLIEVEWDGERSGSWVVLRSRSRPSTGPSCCATWPTVLADHHVNIVSCVDPHQRRPGGPPPLRLRAVRPLPPRLDPRRRAAGRLDLRGVSGPAGQDAWPTRAAPASSPPAAGAPIHRHMALLEWVGQAQKTGAVSLVVPTRNEAGNVIELLGSPRRPSPRTAP